MAEQPTRAALVDDVVRFRQAYVDSHIDQVFELRREITDAEYDAAEREAHEQWRELYPAFTALLPSHLPPACDTTRTTMPDRPKQASDLVSHEHCSEGACETCDCCVAGWCINFEDGSPWDDFLAMRQHFTPAPTPGSAPWEHAREQFDWWAQIAVESRGLSVRPLAENIHRLRERGRVYDTCMCGWCGSDHPAHVAQIVARSTTKEADR
ncbi:MAG: hypothetical protein CMH83_19590 [Nocardioides sp.]|nr:hypothetical protein [Nocardioides sp.]